MRTSAGFSVRERRETKHIGEAVSGDAYLATRRAGGDVNVRGETSTFGGGAISVAADRSASPPHAGASADKVRAPRWRAKSTSDEAKAAKPSTFAFAAKRA
jgi:hypothetical protein